MNPSIWVAGLQFGEHVSHDVRISRRAGDEVPNDLVGQTGPPTASVGRRFMGENITTINLHARSAMRVSYRRLVGLPAHMALADRQGKHHPPTELMAPTEDSHFSFGLRPA